MLVFSKIDYQNPLCVGLPLKVTWRLQQVQNMAARQVSGVNKFDCISPVLVHLHWLHVAFLSRSKVLVHNFLGTCYLLERLSLRASIYITHSSQASLPAREAMKTVIRNYIFLVISSSFRTRLLIEVCLYHALRGR